MKHRLDIALAQQGLVASRSQAESYIRLGKVKVNGKLATKAGQLVDDEAKIAIAAGMQYVSRAALKLESADKVFKLSFQDAVVLDVGSSTGGFTQYALEHGAQKVVAVDVGTNQLHPSLRDEPRIELHEKTDIRQVWLRQTESRVKSQESSSESQGVIMQHAPDIVVADVSFISLREILPHVSRLMSHDSVLLAMVKPQFEVYAEYGRSAGHPSTSSGFRGKPLHKGVIKNDRMRRDILRDFELWAKTRFYIIDKADSEVAGGKGNLERFYLMKKLV